MKTCYQRRRVLGTLAAFGLAGPSMLAVAQANPLMWALRTLITRALTRRQVQAITQQMKQVLTYERSYVAEPAAAVGFAIRQGTARLGTQLWPADDCQCEACECDPMDNATVQYAEAGPDGQATSGMEQWDGRKAQSLFLKIPAGREYVNDVLVLAITDLQTGRQTIIDEHRLALMPSKKPIDLTVPVSPVNARGPHSFSASIPAMPQRIVIQDTPPVLLL
ncbi:MAG: hypothetical protein AB8B97_17925 [Granulosicoccus sp.]